MEARFLLMEVIIALAIFSLAALPMLRALTLTARIANESQMDLHMMGVLESQLTLHARDPKIREIKEGDKEGITEPDELGVWTETVITEMTDKNGELLETDESAQGGKQQLQQMFHVIVTAHYERDGQKGDLSADTYRYAPLYRQQQTTGAQPITTQ